MSAFESSRAHMISLTALLMGIAMTTPGYADEPLFDTWRSFDLAEFEASINTLFGNGDGTYGAQVMLDAGWGGTHDIVAHDLNGDGHVDLIGQGAGGYPASTPGASIIVLLGNGDVRYASFGIPVTYVVGGAIKGSGVFPTPFLERGGVPIPGDPGRSGVPGVSPAAPAPLFTIV